MSDVPDGAKKDVARMALAWEMVKASALHTTFAEDTESNLRRLVSAYNRTWRAIVDEKPLAPVTEDEEAPAPEVEGEEPPAPKSRRRRATGA